MRLVACASCHIQYDVTDVSAKTIDCRCGESVDTTPLRAIESQIARCGSCGASVSRDAERCDYCASQIVRDRAALSLICPECFARSAQSARFCTACGVAFRPEKVRLDGHEFPCPVCSSLMPPRQIAGVGLNECPGCRGLWIAGEGFDVLVARAIDTRQNATAVQLQLRKPRTTGANPAAQRVQYRKCPECDAFMQRSNYGRKSGVIVDRCPSHGSWLDADELEQIAGFISSGANGVDPSNLSASDRLLEADASAALIRIQHRNTPHRRHPDGGIVESLFELLSEMVR